MHPLTGRVMGSMIPGGISRSRGPLPVSAVDPQRVNHVLQSASRTDYLSGLFS